jgi:hypothetical protein
MQTRTLLRKTTDGHARNPPSLRYDRASKEFPNKERRNERHCKLKTRRSSSLPGTGLKLHVAEGLMAIEIVRRRPNWKFEIGNWKFNEL